MDAVCFDMDGVVVDSEDYWIDLERERVIPEALPDADVSVDELTGVYYEELYGILEEDYDLAVEYDEFCALYEGAAEEIYGEKVALTPGVREVVDDLREAGVPVAMVTSSPPEWYEIVLDRFGLAFDVTVSAADLDGPGKPEPGIYERAAAELGVAPGDCVAVEDSANGTLAASRAGMTVIGFGVGEAGHGLAESAADTVAETPDALREQLFSRV